MAALKLRVEIGETGWTLDAKQRGGSWNYAIGGEGDTREGSASVVEVMPGVFSVLENGHSYTVRVLRTVGGWEAWTGGRRWPLRLFDPRDSQTGGRGIERAGPQEIRAQMPGKVVKVLVELGAEIEEGKSVAVVEAMKMQNEMKSPKSGRVAAVYVSEGAAVAAGEPLILVE